MSSPFLNRINKRSKTAHGLKSEKRLSKKLKGQAHPGSGAFDRKGDFSTKDFLYEAKSTVHASIAIRKDDLDKVEKQALMVGRKPVLNLSFVMPSGTGRDCDYALLRLIDFEELIEAANAKS